MNKDYCSNSEGKVRWFRKVNPMFNIILVCVFLFTFILNWYIGIIFFSNDIEKNIKKLLQFQGFKYSHLTNQEEEQKLTQVASNTNCHFLKFGSSGSGRTSFLKYCLDQTKLKFIVFGRDSTEYHEQNFIPLLQLEKFNFESLANKTVILDDTGAYKSPKTKFEALFRFGRHHDIQVI